MRALQVSAQVGHLAGHLATDGTPGQAFVHLAVKRQRADVVVGAATDVAVQRRTCGEGDTAEDEGNTKTSVCRFQS